MPIYSKSRETCLRNMKVPVQDRLWVPFTLFLFLSSPAEAGLIKKYHEFREVHPVACHRIAVGFKVGNLLLSITSSVIQIIKL